MKATGRHSHHATQHSPRYRNTLQWDVQVILSLLVGISCFLLLGWLTRRWSDNGKIPEYTNQKIN